MPESIKNNQRRGKKKAHDARRSRTGTHTKGHACIPKPPRRHGARTHVRRARGTDTPRARDSTRRGRDGAAHSRTLSSRPCPCRGVAPTPLRGSEAPRHGGLRGTLTDRTARTLPMRSRRRVVRRMHVRCGLALGCAQLRGFGTRKRHETAMSMLCLDDTETRDARHRLSSPSPPHPPPPTPHPHPTPTLTRPTGSNR